MNSRQVKLLSFILLDLIILTIILYYKSGSARTCFTQKLEMTLEYPESCKRVIYNIAHMVNSVPEVTHYLNQGANGIECDVDFNSKGLAERVHHGMPCDCDRSCDGKENLTTYLRHIKALTTPGTPEFRPELVVLLLDLKLENVGPLFKYRAGASLAGQLIDHLWTKGEQQSQVHVILSIQYTSDKKALESSSKLLEANLSESIFRNKIGWDVSMSPKLGDVKSLFSEMKMEEHLSLGYGITNCLNFISHILYESKLRKAVEEQRDASWGLKRVYAWTIDDEQNMRKHLRMPLDAIITNLPDKLNKILSEPEFRSKTRLATIEDSPWMTSSCKTAQS